MGTLGNSSKFNLMRVTEQLPLSANSLTSYLQHEFARLSPPDWHCSREVSLLAPDLADLLGYAPRADVLLEQLDGTSRLWIEFEVSRADPVANHAKFATAPLFQPRSRGDAFISMVSPHVARGRRNLAANTIQVMRQIGMNAFQTVLFPHMSGLEVQRLNHLSRDSLTEERPEVEPEFERALAVSQPILTQDDCRLHFAGDITEVMLNLRQWNDEILTTRGAQQWGRRTVTYFVHNPVKRYFAPSKFCAYVPVPLFLDGITSRPGGIGAMTLGVYANLDRATKIFDGTRARTHLTKRLGLLECTPMDHPEIAFSFELWLSKHNDAITVSPSGPVFLVPPSWFA
ncbi:MAG TPA: hypothetical protein VHS06_10380 [Chloroflexota bacterium]|nr:hypothetical protein [Chloroflexota bacterium]